MTGAIHGYNLRSKDKTKIEHCDQVIFMFDSFDESKGVEVSQSWWLEGGSTASSGTGAETRHDNIRSHQYTCAVHRDCDLDEEGKLRAKQMRMESWMLKQRAERLDREADEVDRIIERKTKEGTFDEDSESEMSESESTMMVCDEEEEEETLSAYRCVASFQKKKEE
ncbi:hypothetical protein BGW80DRAFT_1445656 [Lactifluus volemus]|nr:hypothetical protein BGW80DRAFT_1445656 [Lactifluus volemus]